MTLYGRYLDGERERITRECAALYRKGYSIEYIAKEMRMENNQVLSAVRRAHLPLHKEDRKRF